FQAEDGIRDFHVMEFRRVLFRSKIKQLLFLISSFVILTSYITNAQIAVSGDTIYTMAGEKIDNGIILIKDDKIEKVGLQSEIEIPADYKIVKGKVVTPGLIDAHSVVGL